MYRLNTLSKIACGVGLLVFCLPLSSSATVYSEKTIVHFNQPVEIPGAGFGARNLRFPAGELLV